MQRRHVQNQSSLPIFSVVLYPIFQSCQWSCYGVISRCQEKFPKILRYCYSVLSSNLPTGSDSLTSSFFIFWINGQGHLHQLTRAEAPGNGITGPQIPTFNQPRPHLLCIIHCLSHNKMYMSDYVDRIYWKPFFVCLLAITGLGLTEVGNVL
jgi:hypothetical protein